MTAVTLAIQRLNGTIKRLDRVVLAALGVFAALAVAAPAQAVESLVFTLGALGFIAPFLAFSVVVAASARASGADQQMARVFGGRPVAMIAAAAAFGALSPFCSCGVIPIIAGLLGAGVPLAPVMAFWISSPIMDPEMYILTGAVFGFPFATAKALAALFMGLAAGYATHALKGTSAFADPLRGTARGRGACAAPAVAEDAAVVWTFWRWPARRGIFIAEARATGWFLLKWLTLAFVIESLMVAYLPADTVAGWLGGDHWWTIPASVAAGVPAYLNGYAAIPTVAALVDMGMAPGAALAFMVAGAVTSIPAAMAVFALVRRGVFFWYLVLGISGSVLAGYAYQAVV